MLLPPGRGFQLRQRDSREMFREGSIASRSRRCSLVLYKSVSTGVGEAQVLGDRVAVRGRLTDLLPRLRFLCPSERSYAGSSPDPNAKLEQLDRPVDQRCKSAIVDIQVVVGNFVRLVFAEIELLAAAPHFADLPDSVL